MQHIRSFCVDDPEVALVIDVDTGILLTAQEVLSGDEGRVVQQRVDVAQRIAAKRPRFLCALCHIPVRIVCLMDRRLFFFRHTIEDGRCSARTHGTLSEAQINALRYDGQKEGPDHLRIKEQIQRSLECDPGFSEIRVERYFRGAEPGTWRKPDVHGVKGGIRICFEAQLSTTFLRVMAERREFYLKESAALIWVFKEFPIDSRRRLLQDDIFYTNNRNVFIVNSHTLAESQRRRCFVMLCRWLQPTLTGDQLTVKWRDELTCFDRLTIDREGQRVYLFDCEGEAARLRKIAWDASWLGQFEHYWTTTPPGELKVDEGWRKIRQGRGKRDGLWVDRYPEEEGALRGLLYGLYSLKAGRPVGWKHTMLVEVIHRSLATSPASLGILARAVKHYGRVEQILKEDKSGRLARKIHQMAGLTAPGDAIDWHRIVGLFGTNSLDWLLVDLFPELYGYRLHEIHPSKRSLPEKTCSGVKPSKQPDRTQQS